MGNVDTLLDAAFDGQYWVALVPIQTWSTRGSVLPSQGELCRRNISAIHAVLWTVQTHVMSLVNRDSESPIVKTMKEYELMYEKCYEKVSKLWKYELKLFCQNYELNSCMNLYSRADINQYIIYEVSTRNSAIILLLFHTFSNIDILWKSIKTFANWNRPDHSRTNKSSIDLFCCVFDEYVTSL